MDSSALPVSACSSPLLIMVLMSSCSFWISHATGEADADSNVLSSIFKPGVDEDAKARESTFPSRLPW